MVANRRGHDWTPIDSAKNAQFHKYCNHLDRNRSGGKVGRRITTRRAGKIAGLRFRCVSLSFAEETDMAKKRDSGRKETRLQKESYFSRRDFFKSGAAAGVSAAVVSGPGQASAQGIAWNYEVDVVVCGAGCTGLHAAIRARDLGASVLVVDSNFDVSKSRRNNDLL